MDNNNSLKKKRKEKNTQLTHDKKLNYDLRKH